VQPLPSSAVSVERLSGVGTVQEPTLCGNCPGCDLTFIQGDRVIMATDGLSLWHQSCWQSTRQRRLREGAAYNRAAAQREEAKAS
jgi:hypothetical protein